MKKNYFTKHVRLLLVLVITLSGLIPLSSWASPASYYRSVASGFWDMSTTWETSPDGVNSWTPATNAPINGDNIEVQTGHTVILTSDFTIGHLELKSGGKINIDIHSLTVTDATNTLQGTVMMKLESATENGYILFTNAVDVSNLSAKLTLNSSYTPAILKKFSIITSSVSVTGPLHSIEMPATTGWQTVNSAFQIEVKHIYNFYRTYGGGLWSDVNRWDYSNDGVTWNPASDYPHSGNEDSTIVQSGHTMVFTESITIAKGLNLQSGATLDLGSNELVVTSYATFNGSMISKLTDATTYGKVLSASKSINISGLSVTVNVESGYSPTSPTTYTLFKVSNSANTVSGTPTITLPSGANWSTSATTTAFNVVFSEPKRYFRSATSGDWRTNSTWEYSTNGTTWAAATSFPLSSNTDSIFIQSGHTVSLATDATAQGLNLMIGGKIDIGKNELTLSGKATLNGEIALLIFVANQYGTVHSIFTGTQDITNLHFTITNDAGYTPNTIVNFDIIGIPFGAFNGSPDLLNQTLPWQTMNWSDGYGPHMYTITYDGTTTKINESKSSTSAFVSNGKLIYHGGTVYNVFGTKVASSLVKEEIALQPGIYFVKAGNRVQKVLVK